MVPDPFAVAIDHASHVWQLIKNLDVYERRFVVEAIGTGHRGQSQAIVRVTPQSLDVVQAALAFLPPEAEWPQRRAVSEILSAFVDLDSAIADARPPLSETRMTLGEHEARTRASTDASPATPSQPAR